MMMPGKAKRSRPILAALGTPSRTAPAPQAILNRTNIIPNDSPDNAIQFSGCF
jgi:hypothetical protein